MISDSVGKTKAVGLTEHGLRESKRLFINLFKGAGQSGPAMTTLTRPRLLAPYAA